MRLSDLCADIALDPRIAGLDIAGLTADSRAVKPGYLFAALQGGQADGRRFIPDAAAKGAVAVLTDSVDPAFAPQLAFVTDPNPRRRLALMAAAFFGAQPATVAAVTGTSGKTSVAHFTAQIWSAMGRRAASLGTLGLHARGLEIKVEHTTPDPVTVHGLLAKAAAAGVDCLALEASSHGLDQFRLDGVRIKAAAFTNLSRDHFDYHPDEQHYFGAKLRLFTELLAADGTAVVNADAAQAPTLMAVARRRGQRVIRYGFAGEDLRVRAVTPHAAGLRLAFEAFGEPHAVDLPLIGAFQAGNALAAAGLVIGCGASVAAAAAGLGTLQGVPGRMEKAAMLSNGAAVFVDYAHKPDALETALRAARPHAKGRLIVVFGCGGDRDPGKRPMMGAIAARRADVAIVTDDNPRSEPPAAIRAAVLAACPEGIEIGERREAIRAAVKMLAPGDLLLIAGKGHEQGQILGGEVRPFDDASEARDAVRAVDPGSDPGSAPYGSKD